MECVANNGVVEENIMNMRICFISNKYPGKHNKSDYAFVKQLVDAIAEQGHHCYVLSPFNISYYRQLSPLREEYDRGNGKVTVLRPGYISLSRFHIGKFSPSSWFHMIAYYWAYKKMGVIPDVIYGHFWGSGYVGYRLAKKHNIPLFVATGESDIKRLFKFPSDLCAFRDYVKGVICVSSKNRDESIGLGLTVAEKCRVFPNAVNTRLFCRKNKCECRKMLGVTQDTFIVAFVGWFIDRKGPKRVADAIEKVCGVNSFFIGKGEQEPQCDGILFKGTLPHEEVPLYLGAADCFVLPTLAEGCCNAVVEAMACGLPIISSNLPFNWDVLDNTNSIMVDPYNVDEIAEAIRILKEDPNKCKKLSVGALKKAEGLSIGCRAEGIVKYMEECLNK